MRLLAVIAALLPAPAVGHASLAASEAAMAETPTVPLPEATAVDLDLGVLARGADWWHAFRFGGGDPHVGYLHLAMVRDGEQLVCVYDWCFHGEGYPIIGDYTRSRHALGAGLPAIVSALNESNDGLDATAYAIVADATGGSAWVGTVAASRDGRRGPRPLALPAPAPLAGALQMQLACLMPKRVGACIHYAFAAWDGTASAMALRVEGEETIALADGAQRHAWRVQHHHDRGPGMIEWIGDDGTPLRIDFGAAMGHANSELSTREAATSGLDPAIHVRLEGAPLSAR